MSDSANVCCDVIDDDTRLYGLTNDFKILVLAHEQSILSKPWLVYCILLTGTRRPNSTPADLRMGLRARAVDISALMRLFAISFLTTAEADPATGSAGVVAVIVASMIGTKASVRL